jgi:hypothetical protein
MPMNFAVRLYPRGARGWLWRRLLVTTACAAFADWLFYCEPGGLSLALFLVILAIAAACLNPVRADGRLKIVASTVLIAGLLALLEDLNWLSFWFGALGTALFAGIMSSRDFGDWWKQLKYAVGTFVPAPIRLTRDCLRVRALASRRRFARVRPGTATISDILSAWIVPIGFRIVFLGLFTLANPVIETWGSDIYQGIAIPDFVRIGFWIFIVVAIWPLIHARPRGRKSTPTSAAAISAVEPADLDVLFGEAAILRSLVLFNALFALQTAMDVVYLWGGMSLPHGMTHATYAHRGAYPLIMTALLAGAFVLIAMRQGGPGEKSKTIVALVLIWTSQNILLVLSSILRLDIYIAAYSLTYLRIAAFIWMLLIASGLASIIVKIVRRKSNGWLVTINAALLALTLYACCFIDFANIIADQNLRQSEACGGERASVDIAYIYELGPDIIPTLDRYSFCLGKILSHTEEWQPRYADQKRAYWMAQHATSYRTWRTWSLTAWRLDRYLVSNPQPSSAPEPKTLNPETP